MKQIIEKLLLNSKSSQLACIEIHNKPIFPFRYETCVILNINSWELLLKAFILKNHPDVKVIRDDGTTKPFDECLAFTSSVLGKGFIVTRENINKLYEYRCNVIHFYDDDIDILIFSLLGKSVLLYHEFLINHFDVDIANEINLVLLPIGFSKPTSPIDFLSNSSKIAKSSDAVQTFVKSIMKSTATVAENHIEDSILYSFRMSLINESRIKNADIVAAITKDTDKSSISLNNQITKFVLADNASEEGVRKVIIDEESLFRTIYTQTHNDVLKNCKKLFLDFKNNQAFNTILKNLQNKPQFHKVRYLNLSNPKGGYKNYYSEKLYDELAKHYTRKEISSETSD